jgi:hypothetical protein
MTDRPQTTDPFEEMLAGSLARYAADAGGTGDAYAIADAMLEARRNRRFRIGLAAVTGVLATAVLAGIAIGALAEPQPRVGPGPTQSLRPTESVGTESAAPSSEPTPETLPDAEAPEACGFPDGTGLSYAGRSTTAALDVQEVVGDPMSFDPADIYVTSDRVDWGGWGRVRLVCAIFVDQPDFVEITVHPDDGGRYSPTPAPSAPEPSDGISRKDAVSAARDALPDAEEWDVHVVEAGPLGRVALSGWADSDWGRGLSADLWVWRVFLVRGDRGADVVIDFVDGSVYGITEGIVN